MSDTTPRSALPLLAAAQSQKHVTHNEALLEIDALTCCNILDRDLSAPPSTPADGDTYLVKATGTGLWAGQDGKIAFAVDGAWRFYAPYSGLVAYIADEQKLIVYNGSGWLDYASVLALQNVPELGVNATADSTNKLTVASAAVLFDNIGAGVQAKLNKHASGDTASLLYQTNFSGRAEVGLTGDDNFHFKVSPDGSAFYESLILNRNTGSVLLKHIDISGATTLGAAHLGRMVRADATSSAFNVTLPASADTDDWVIVRKKDSGANRVTVKTSGGSDVAWLSAQSDEAMFAFWDGAWTPVRASIRPITDVFTASGTWTKPPLARCVEAIVIAGAGGGGSGRRGAAGTARAGGQAGQGGTLCTRAIDAAALSGTESVTVGAGGSGGAAQTGDSSDGNAGTAGGNSAFGAHLVGPGGSAGPGGSTSQLASGATIQGFRGSNAIAQMPVTVTAASGSPTAAGCGTGGNGGSIASSNTAFDGAAGANGSFYASTQTAGGNGGTSGAAGSAGAAVTDVVNQLGGGGGGGGGATTASAAGAGANGGAPGGGGGGGGASVNGNASGAGGAGSRGEVRITTYF